MKHTFEIVIVGAGMVGLTMAALLKNGPQGGQVRLTVLDAGDKPVYDREADTGIRVSAISPGSSRILSEAGCWGDIESTGVCPYRGMRVWDEGGDPEGAETLRFDAAEFAVPQLGHIVENELIRSALLSSLESSDAEIQFATPISSIRKSGDRYIVEVQNGRTISADLLLAADGGNSLVRREAGIDVNSWRYPQTALVTHLRPEKSHRNIAWQRFLPSGPVALLPLGDGRVSTVWSTTAGQAAIAKAADDVELGLLLSDASDGVLGRLVPDGPRGTFPLRAQHAEQYVLPGLALLGDAAHSVHPLAGQGVNLGLADAATLADVIAEALSADEHPGDLPVLRRYERARKGANKAMLHFVDGINRLFSVATPPAARLRGGGMRLFNATGALRQQVVKVALGIGS
jgi:2-octaprenylphenol hydroxylase